MNKSEDSGDAAWVTIETPFDAPWLMDFVLDIERIFRINSLMNFTSFEQTGPGDFRIEGRNLSNGRQFSNQLRIEQQKNGVCIHYGDGLKTFTRLEIENQNLVITDDYSGTSPEIREKRLDEVDKSLVQWGRDIHRYLKQWKRWQSLPGWKWYMRRIWQPMKPMARRITFLLIVISAMEFVVFLCVFLIFWLELDRFID